jgi:glycosyltransferase involved in cell wall biosynthesis
LNPDLAMPTAPARADDAGGDARRPSITIVTVCRNALALLRPTVESVLSQRTPSVEYWIVDGASTDGTRAYLEELAGRGVRFVSEPDRGIADAMNKGVRLSAGAWIAHLHAGDAYLPGALDAVLARVAAAEAPDAVPARAVSEGPDPRSTRADVLCGSILKREERGETLYRPAPERLRLDMTVHHPAAFTRRAVFESLGGFDPSYPNAMDYDFFLRALAAGFAFEVIPRPLARMAGEGQSERSLWATYRETHRIRKRVLGRGWECSTPYFVYLVTRGSTRRALQRMGLRGLVRWFRRRFALAPKA